MCNNLDKKFIQTAVHGLLPTLNTHAVMDRGQRKFEKQIVGQGLDDIDVDLRNLRTFLIMCFCHAVMRPATAF